MVCAPSTDPDEGYRDSLGRAGGGSFPRVAVYTLTMERIEYTRRMVDSIRRHTAVPFDHYVVDNGSTDGTAAYLMENAPCFAGVELSPTNLGIDVGSRRALAMIGGGYDYIVKVDNDCEFLESDWLAVLLQVSEAFSGAIAVSPLVEGLGSWLDGGYPRERYVTAGGHRIGLAKHVGGLCIMTPADAYDGFLMKGRTLHDDTDVAFSIHLRLTRGYQMGYVEDLKVRHMDTTAGQWQRYPEYFRNRNVIQTRTVYGEPKAVTIVLRPFRRFRELRSKRKAGLLDVPVPTYLLRKLTGGPPGRAKGP